ncbi:MAG: response regulator transcription factor [Sedimentisphaerales bacterium]|nr:response regulator transcription factor [Sedimentisphaerales bacterium]
MSINILLADDHRIFREGLRKLIEEQPDMKVVAEVDDGRAAVDLSQRYNPDVVIMDISMPSLNGIDATEQIIKQNPNIKVIALSIHNNKRFASYMFKAGAAGYLTKSCCFDELTQAIISVVTGHTYMSPEITDVVIGDYVDKIPHEKFTFCGQLSNREREVLQLIAEGKSTKEVAVQLHVSAKTVASHREHIMNKLNIHNVVELARYAVREGLTSFELSK